MYLSIEVHQNGKLLFGYEVKRDFDFGSHSYLIRRIGEIAWSDYVNFWFSPNPRKLTKKVLSKMRERD